MASEKTIKTIVKFAAGLKGIDSAVLGDALEIEQLHRRVEQVFEREWTQWGLSAMQIRIMVALFHNPDEAMTPATLSEDVMLTRSAMTSVLDLLEKNGYVKRRPHPGDRRKIIITLTPSGHKFLDKRLPGLYAKVHRMMSGLTKKERIFLLKIHQKILAHLVNDEFEEGS